MVVNSDGQFFLGFFLSHHVLVEKRLDFRWPGRLGLGSGNAFAPLLLQDRIADGHALVADVSAGKIARRRNELTHRILRLPAE
jgi:hypothetical protein